MPHGYIVEQQALAAQAAARQAAAAATAAAADAAAAAALRAEGVTCDMAVPSTGRRCDIVAVRRCATCGLAYCGSHASRDRPAEGDTNAARAVIDLCVQCQDAARKAERKRQRAARERAEAEARERRERLERDKAEHAARVVRHETASGWAGSQKRVAWLTARLSRSASIREISHTRITIAVIVGFFGFLWLLATVFWMSSEEPQLYALSVMVLPVVGVWLAWTYWRVRRQERRAAYRRELNKLEQGRGCGDKACRRCAAQVRL